MVLERWDFGLADGGDNGIHGCQGFMHIYTIFATQGDFSLKGYHLTEYTNLMQQL